MACLCLSLPECDSALFPWGRVLGFLWGRVHCKLSFQDIFGLIKRDILSPKACLRGVTTYKGFLLTALSLVCPFCVGRPHFKDPQPKDREGLSGPPVSGTEELRTSWSPTSRENGPHQVDAGCCWRPSSCWLSGSNPPLHIDPREGCSSAGVFRLAMFLFC